MIIAIDRYKFMFQHLREKEGLSITDLKTLMREMRIDKFRFQKKKKLHKYFCNDENLLQLLDVI